MLLTLTVNFSLRTTAIDFRSTFIQAKLDRPFYAQIPPYLGYFPTVCRKDIENQEKFLWCHCFTALIYSTSSSMTTWSNPRTRADSASVEAEKKRVLG